jgi:chromosome partitioning protein
MGKIIAIANQKGGVGKTTTAGTMAAALHGRGYKVLGVDADPQGNFSSSAKAEMYQSPTTYHLLKKEATADEAIQHLNVFDMIPANIMLAGAEQELTQTGKEHRLKEELAAIEGRYDYIIIDTPPSLGILTVNAFTAAHEILIPTTAGIFAANAIEQLYNTYLNVQKYCNRNLEISGILLTRFNPRTNINQSIMELTHDLGEHIKAPVFTTFIRSSVVVEEAQANQLDLFTYKANSTVAEDYNAFVDEYLAKGND